METQNENSSPCEEPGDKTEGVAVETTPVFTKKDFVFTDKRKENLIKANKARKQNNEDKKKWKEFYENAMRQTQTLYENKVQNNNKLDSIPSSLDDKKVEKKEMSELKIEKVVKEEKLKKDSVESASDSEEEVKIQSRQKTVKKKGAKKRVVYVDPSDESGESEEEVVILKKKGVSRRPKKEKVYCSSEEEDDEESSEEDKKRHVAYLKQKTRHSYINTGLSGSLSNKGTYSGCRF
jgi:hypothetical protein